MTAGKSARKSVRDELAAVLRKFHNGPACPHIHVFECAGCSALARHAAEPETAESLYAQAIAMGLRELESPPPVRVLTQEQAREMPCPLPPEPGYEDPTPKLLALLKAARAFAEAPGPVDSDRAEFRLRMAVDACADIPTEDS